MDNAHDVQSNPEISLSLSGVRVVVIGAGISGLTVAHAIQQRGADVSVLEARHHPGGRIRTLHEDGFLIETGPNAVLARPSLLQVLGSPDIPIVPAPPRAARYIVHDGTPTEIPLHPMRLLASPILPLRAKLRALKEPWIRKGDPGMEETVAGFITRRFGPGVLPLADAMVTGIHAGDPARISARHTLGPMMEWDRQGGILRNLRKSGRQHGFGLVAPKHGMQQWTERLAEQVHISYDEPVLAIQSDQNRQARHTVRTKSRRLRADHVVLATDSPTSSRLLGATMPGPVVAPLTIVAFALPRDNKRLNGYGVLAPEQENRFLLGAIFESDLFPHRAPPDCSLIRCFIGGRRHPERAELGDEQLIKKTWQDLRTLGIVQKDPLQSWVVRTPGIPQLETGHARWLSSMPQRPGIHVIGMGHEAIGVPALVDQAVKTVDNIATSPSN